MNLDGHGTLERICYNVKSFKILALGIEDTHFLQLCKDANMVLTLLSLETQQN